MTKVRELPLDLINKIAAGEVIESAQSVVKELAENSMDAGADFVSIETTHGGLEKILISDNGSGIPWEDLPVCIKRHTTSKIQKLEDLETVLSFGFRGEALSSIASVSKMKILSGQKEDEPSGELQAEMSEVISLEQRSGRKGTLIEVRDLFYNTPVRRKFLKSERAEDKKIKDRITNLALSRPDVGFQYVQNSKEIIKVKPEPLKERILSMLGNNLEKYLLEVHLERRGISAFGFISSPEFYKSNRTGQYIFINSRPVELKYSSHLLRRAYDELIPSGSHPWCFLYFSIDPRYIDVNVHPTKKEIRFLDEEGFNAFFIELINRELRSKTPVSFLELKRRLSNPVESKSENKSNLFQSPQSTEPRSTFQEILHDTLYQIPTQQSGFSLDQVGAGTRLDGLTDSPIKSREFVPKKHFGILFETFILAEAEDGLYIIDQHTAHERIRYEEVLREMRNLQGKSQPLLAPLRLDFSKAEVEEILDKAIDFLKIGIVLESFGEDSILVRETPPFLDPGSEREVIIDFLDRIKESSSQEKELYDLMAKCVACRSAIKKGDHVSDHILGELLNRLSYCENPSRCPHGRPTLVKLTRFDLEKMFHRR